ncbi:MAG TPA: ribosome small subunit-dependent GTPase A [Casimicrobiaceae bacterium]|nr:ribosome small subunit-dependent GTPase A [Casimicrobiaceae bacterium]
MSVDPDKPGHGHRHAMADRVSGLVVAAHRRHYLVEVDGGELVECVLKGRKMTLACGDRVDVERAVTGSAIVEVLPRGNVFYRSDAFREKLIAANVTQVLGVVAPDVPVDEHLLNRWIIAAETAQCRFVLVVNKADLPDSDAFAARFAPYATLGYPVLRVSATQDVAALRPWIARQHSVVIGQSGMGKSTLINALLPETRARVGEISQALRSGRHTTSSTALYRLAGDDGWIVDSPGMTVFGLAHCTPSAIEHAFVELRELAGECRFRDCRHDTEPGCVVQAAVRAGRIAPQRVELLRTLLREVQAARDPAR